MNEPHTPDAERRGRRCVVLTFDEGDRADYHPPLPHPADVFLAAFVRDPWMGLGASTAYEISEQPPLDGHEVHYPAPKSGRPTWLGPPG